MVARIGAVLSGFAAVVARLSRRARHDQVSQLAVRGEHAVVAGQVSARPRHERGQACHEVLGAEHDVCGAIVEGMFELVNHVPCGVEA